MHINIDNNDLRTDKESDRPDMGFFLGNAGITIPMTVLEQMTYLLFMKLIDDAQRQRVAISNEFDLEYPSDDTFSYGSWHNPETDEDIDVGSLR